MSKAVLISIRPKWCELIANGSKTIEVRKTMPNIETPFKCYIYCTKPSKKHQTICGCMVINTDELYRHPVKGIKHDWSGELMCLNNDYGEEYTYDESNFLNGKVIGEFVCDEFFPISVYYSNPNSAKARAFELPLTCLTDKEVIDYLGNGKQGCGWHISDLKIYENPKELSAFRAWKQTKFGVDTNCVITRPPQSWCYIDGV